MRHRGVLIYTSRHRFDIEPEPEALSNDSESLDLADIDGIYQTARHRALITLSHDHSPSQSPASGVAPDGPYLMVTSARPIELALRR